MGVLLACRGMRVGNMSYSATDLRLGCLQGNEFTLVMRQVEADELGKASFCDNPLGRQRSPVMSTFDL